MPVVFFLSINLFALLNCIWLFHSEPVQSRGKGKVLNKGGKGLHGRRRKSWWRESPDHGEPVPSVPCEEKGRERIVNLGRRIIRDMECSYFCLHLACNGDFYYSIFPFFPLLLMERSRAGGLCGIKEWLLSISKTFPWQGQLPQIKNRNSF